MAKEISKQALSLFEQIKQTDENGNEYWPARQLAKVLEYSDFRNFSAVITKALWLIAWLPSIHYHFRLFVLFVQTNSVLVLIFLLP